MSEDLGQRKYWHPRCGNMISTAICEYCLIRDAGYRKFIQFVTDEVDSAFVPADFEEWRIRHQW